MRPMKWPQLLIYENRSSTVGMVKLLRDALDKPRGLEDFLVLLRSCFLVGRWRISPATPFIDLQQHICDILGMLRTRSCVAWPADTAALDKSELDRGTPLTYAI